MNCVHNPRHSVYLLILKCCSYIYYMFSFVCTWFVCPTPKLRWFFIFITIKTFHAWLDNLYIYIWQFLCTYKWWFLIHILTGTLHCISLVLFLCESTGVSLLIHVSFISLCIHVSDHRSAVDWFNLFTFPTVESVSGEFVTSPITPPGSIALQFYI